MSDIDLQDAPPPQGGDDNHDDSRAVDASELLVEKGIISQAQLDIALAQHRRLLAQGVRSTVDDIIVTNGFASREQVATSQTDLDQRMRNDESPAAMQKTSAMLRMAIPQNLCRRLGVRPLRTVENKLYVAATRTLTEAEKDELIIAVPCLIH